jgi:hypothetical protein
MLRQGGTSGEGAAAAEEAEAEDLPAYQFRMGLGEMINQMKRTQYCLASAGIVGNQPAAP